MAGTGLRIDSEIQGIDALQRRLAALANPGARGELLESIGAVVESQTRRRIEEEKTAPDGEPWADWSEEYAKTRHGGHSLLMGEGDLGDSIQFAVTGDAVEVGTNLIYGAIHQFGGDEVGMPIPARPYLGLSADDGAELVDIVNDWIDATLEAGL